LLATQGLVRAAQKVAATPMRASARKLEARFFACETPCERLSGMSFICVMIGL